MSQPSSHPWRRCAGDVLEREDRSPGRRCPMCGGPLPPAPDKSGRDRIWCSRPCRDRAHRLRLLTIEHVEVPVERLRAVFAASGMSKCELARRMGWTKIVPNTYHLNVTLGIVPASNTRRPRTHVTYAMAVRLARAMNVDLRKVGV